MPYDVVDTIAAIGSPTGAGSRGVVRIGGPHALELIQCWTRQSTEDGLGVAPINQERPTRCSASLAVPFQAGTAPRNVGIDVAIYAWPTHRSYTGQPLFEIHTWGSDALLSAILAEACRRGARLARRGEFTLRAFIAGRLDLAQAEAVLGVIHAHGSAQLDVALRQLAGGFSQPLHRLRDDLLNLCADLEAGLDFVDEDIQFIEPAEVTARLSAAAHQIRALAEQLEARSSRSAQAKFALVGPPNAGKSSLFNALVEFANVGGDSRAIVSQVPGTTRDVVLATLAAEEFSLELADTAGWDAEVAPASIESAAQRATREATAQTDCRLICLAPAQFGSFCPSSFTTDGRGAALPADSTCWLVATKSDEEEALPEEIELATRQEFPQFFITSSHTGQGVAELLAAMKEYAAQAEDTSAAVLASTASRCRDALRLAAGSLEEAQQLTNQAAGDELVSAVVRHALTSLGEVVGAVYTDDVLDRIFSRFCIGK